MFRYETFLLTLSWRFRHKEERHNLAMPSYSLGPYLVRHPRRANSSRLSEPQKSNLLVRCLAFNSLTFFRFSPTSARFRCVTSPASCHPLSSRTIVTSLSDISIRLRAPALTPASMLHLTNSCAEPKCSQPN